MTQPSIPDFPTLPSVESCNFSIQFHLDCLHKNLDESTRKLGFDLRNNRRFPEGFSDDNNFHGFIVSDVESMQRAIERRLRAINLHQTILLAHSKDAPNYSYSTTIKQDGMSAAMWAIHVGQISGEMGVLNDDQFTAALCGFFRFDEDGKPLARYLVQYSAAIRAHRYTDDGITLTNMAANFARPRY